MNAYTPNEMFCRAAAGEDMTSYGDPPEPGSYDELTTEIHTNWLYGTQWRIAKRQFERGAVWDAKNLRGYFRDAEGQIVSVHRWDDGGLHCSVMNNGFQCTEHRAYQWMEPVWNRVKQREIRRRGGDGCEEIMPLMRMFAESGTSELILPALELVIPLRDEDAVYALRDLAPEHRVPGYHAAEKVLVVDGHITSWPCYWTNVTGGKSTWREEYDDYAQAIHALWAAAVRAREEGECCCPGCDYENGTDFEAWHNKQYEAWKAARDLEEEAA